MQVAGDVDWYRKVIRTFVRRDPQGELHSLLPRFKFMTQRSMQNKN